MDRHIFVSYSLPDEEVVTGLCEDLKVAKFIVWLHTNDLAEETESWDEIQKNISKADCMVVVLSQNAAVSELLSNEINFARHLANPSIPIVCFLIDGDPKKIIPQELLNSPRIVAHQNTNTASIKLVSTIYEQSRSDTKAQVNRNQYRWNWRIALALVVLLFSAIVGTWSVTRASLGSRVLRTPSLISIVYKGNGFNPRLIDLRTAATNGIPISPGQPLEFINVTIFVAEDTPEYVTQVEVKLENSALVIGKTQAIGMTAGLHNLGVVVPEQFIDADNADAWDTQADWDALSVQVVTYLNGEVVDIVPTSIRLNPNGTSLLWDTPKSNFTSIIYSINNGPQLVLDLRSATETGLNVYAGDTFTLHQIWYSSDTNSEVTLQLEAYVTDASRNYNEATYLVSTPNSVQSGVHRLANFESMSWTITDDERYVVMSLARNDGTVSDRLIVPLNSSTNIGLFNSADAVLWPFDEATYLDFESNDAIIEWTGTTVSTIAVSNAQAFTGTSALAISVTGNAESDMIKAQWDHTFTGEVMIGQVYWPEQAGIDIEWAQACIWACVPINLDVNRWNTFVMDLSELTFQDWTMNTREVSGMLIQAQINSVTEANPYTFYVDGIQLYTAG